MDIALFYPDQIGNRSLAELQSLTVSDLAVLAELFPHEPSIFLIEPSDKRGTTSLATYKSFHWLIAKGHKFKIVGTSNMQVAVKQNQAVDDVVADLAKVEKIEPETQIVKASEAISVSNTKQKPKTKNNGSRKTS